MRTCKFRILLLSFALIAATASTQTTVGIQPFGSYTSGSIDQINLADLGIHIDIPLFEHQSRGQGVGDYMHLVYDTAYTDPGVNLHSTADLGWRIVASTTASPGYIVVTDTSQSTCGYTYSTFSFVDASGYTHKFSQQLVTYTCDGSYPTGTPISETASDGSGYLLFANNSGATVTSPSGINYYSYGLGGGTSAIVDTNGNFAQNTWTQGASVNNSEDATDVELTDPSNVYVAASNGSYPDWTPTGWSSRGATIIQYKDTNGNAQYVTINYTIYNIDNCNYGGYQNIGLISSVVYPDGSAYNFQYRATGAIQSMQLPTGGTITYSGNLGIEASCSPVASAGVTRTTSSGMTTYTRTVQSSQSLGGPGASTTTISKPDSSTETINFAYAAQTAANIAPNSYETTHTWANSAGTTLKTIARCYNASASPCVATPVSLPITQLVTATKLDNGQTSKTTQSLNLQGVPTEFDEYDYGASSPTRKTITTYASLGNNIFNRPHSVTTYDGGGYQIAQTTYGYDEYTLASSGLASGPYPGPGLLTPISGSRGNRTSEHDWVNTTGATLDSHWCYDNAGQVVASQDPAASAHGQSCAVGKATTYGHDSTDTYVTSTTLPTPSSGVSLASSAAYYSAAGLLQSTTDPNGTQVAYTYDSMLRQIQASTFTSSGTLVGKKTASHYTDDPAYNNSTDLNTLNYQSSGASVNSWMLYDTYGRPNRTALANGQGTNPWYQQDVCYNSVGAISFQSYAYQGAGFPQAAACSGPNGDAYSYDALERPISVLHGDGTGIIYSYAGRASKTNNEIGVTKITQVDALGRVTSVCEVSSISLQSVAPVNCGQDIAATGFLTNYSYNLANHTTTITQGAQTRVFQTDSLGRTVYVSEPERGVTNYTYTYSGTAGLGLSVARTRPQANQASASTLTTTTTQYDSLGRAVTVGYNDGLTPSKNFSYDAFPLGWAGQTTTNTKGRLMVIGAILGSSTATWSDSLFSYDAVGDIINTWQCGPNTCGTANQASHALSFAYDWTGALTSQTDYASGDIAYTRSPAGEVTSIANKTFTNEGNPANLVSNVVNGPNGPISYNLGNGLSVSDRYDGMGRPNGGWVCRGSISNLCQGGTQIYGYTVNSRTGPNVTSVSDTVVNKAITYAYDGFNRLDSLTVNSGQVQNYTYGYDRYGNRAAQNALQGGSTFTATVNPANNQFAGYTYDAAGNMTNDGFHTYTYDAEGNVVSVDSGATSQFVYDALNRRVWSNQGGSVNEYAYDAAGHRVSSWTEPSNQGNEGRIYWDGQQLAYRSNDGTTYFDHQDYLGTERMRTNSSGAVAATFNSLPFGDGYGQNIVDSAASQDTLHFAGLDQDLSGSSPTSDHAQFRQYSFVQGRWFSPDPYDGSYDIANPKASIATRMP